VLLGIIALEEFSSAAGERASNRFSITAMLSPYLIDQRRLIFWYKMQTSNNIVLRTLSSLKHYSFAAIAAKYGTNSRNVSFKNAVWQTFSSAVLLKC